MSAARSISIFVLAVLLLIQSRATAAPTTVPSTSPAQPAQNLTTELRAVVIPLSGEIDDATRDDLYRRFKAARLLGAKVVIIEFNTPGGLVSSSVEIARFLRGQDDIHTIAYVQNAAYSGGALVAVACNEVVMSPTSVLGDCAPIVLSNDRRLEPLPPTERAKAESPVLADFYESARKNGFDPLLAEAMVRIGTVVHLMQSPEGKRQVVADKDVARYSKEGWKPAPGVPDPVNDASTLLTVGPELAVQLGLAKTESRTIAALAEQRGYKLVADLTPSVGERLVELLASTPARFLLILIFLQSLYIVLHAPGHGLAEAVAVVAFSVLVGIPLLTGYAQWWEIVVVLLGLALCAFEVLVFPGHGVSLLVGALMVIFGLVMTFAGPVPGQPTYYPATPAAWHGVEKGLMAVAGALVCTVILSSWLRKYLPRMPYFSRLILTATSGAAISQAPAPQTASESREVWPFVGTIGTAVSGLRPGGSARFPYGGDTRIATVHSTGYVAPGGKVIVEQIDGNRVIVRPLA